jgi:hypothetical protein
MDSFWWTGPKALLKNASGWFFYMSTTPTPQSEASVSTIKGRVKSGRPSTGVVDIVVSVR